MRSALALLTSVVAAAAVTGCGATTTGTTSEGTTTIDVPVSNATEPFVVPWLAARDQGFFEERGVIVDQIIPGKGGSSTLRNLLSGDAPIGDIGFNAVADSFESGAEVSAVGSATKSPYGLDFYTTESNSGIQSIEDIWVWAYTNPGSTTEALTYMLPNAAAVTHDVERVASGGLGEGIALLESGEVDVAVLPLSVAAGGDTKFREVVASNEFLGAFQQTLITTTTEYAESHPEVVRAVVEGYQDGADWITANPTEAAALYSQYTDLPQEVTERIITRAIEAGHWGVGFDADAIAAATEGFGITGSGTGNGTICEMFDMRFLPEEVSADLGDC